jgi:hypothetical protein
MARDWWHQRLATSQHVQDTEPPKKVFKPKFPLLPTVPDYQHIEDDGFWQSFPVNFSAVAKSNIDSTKLRELLVSFGIEIGQQEEKVLHWLQHGADIGCSGVYRGASVSSNTKGSYQYGREVSDAIAAWVKQGYAYGPVSEDEVPATAKINSILTRPKPNGAVRVILNLSAPKGMSVNDGIDSDEFPAKMSSTEAWLRVLNRAGRNCFICKIDFADAYKHIAVAQRDTDLQWFEWGGRFFKELCLIFGAASSAGIFDATAKVILNLVCVAANFPRSMVCQHLDDICAAAPADSILLHKFDKKFQEIAGMVGVQLADRADPDKTFGPCHKGTILGVEYDTQEWTWTIPADKLVRLRLTLKEVLAKDSLSAKQALSLIGKLIHIRPLLPAVKFNMFHIMRLSATANQHEKENSQVSVSAACKRQLHFWLVLLSACPGWLSIPRELTPMPWALEAFTDAAGGSLDRLGAGCGGLLRQDWFYFPWPKRVNAGGWRVEGKKVGRKLSALELIGPLFLVACLLPSLRNKQLIIWVDNAGAVAIWRKGYSTRCPLSSTIVTTLNDIAAAVGCTVFLKKITRCSSTGALLADHLSKARFRECRTLAAQRRWQLNIEPLRIPVSLLGWADKPMPSDDLAQTILSELAVSHPILNYSV